MGTYRPPKAVRRVVAIEGVPTVDGRLIEVGALRERPSGYIPVMAFDPNSGGAMRTVGTASALARDERTGEVSFSIQMTAKNVDLEHSNVTIDVMDIDSEYSDEQFVVKAAVVMGLHVGDQPHAWAGLDVLAKDKSNEEVSDG